jgi:hypothetical protein
MADEARGQPDASQAEGVESPPITLKQLLESSPPGRTARVVGAYGFPAVSVLLSKTKTRVPPARGNWGLIVPALDLHCESPRCGGTRIFAGTQTGGTEGEHWRSVFLRYHCRNCFGSTKEYALRLQVKAVEDETATEITKLGEWPAWIARVPSRVFKLMGDDRELFLKGRRAESQDLGIGAFSYYRRVLERQKAALIDKIVAAARRTNAPLEVIGRLERARDAWEFTRAVDEIKEAIPENLRIRGHNPLVLLHRALSKGIHARSDEECLQLAANIRVVLCELADRIGVALRDEEELIAAVTDLLRATEEERTRGAPAGE